MIIADLNKIEGRTYPARRRPQNLVGGASPLNATNFSAGYVTLEPDGAFHPSYPCSFFSSQPKTQNLEP